MRRGKKRREFEGLLAEASALVNALNAVVAAKNAEIEAWQQFAIESQRTTRNLVAAFRIAVEEPEVDIRDDLDVLWRVFSDQIAQLEEHVT